MGLLVAYGKYIAKRNIVMERSGLVKYDKPPNNDRYAELSLSYFDNDGWFAPFKVSQMSTEGGSTLV